MSTTTKIHHSTITLYGAGNGAYDVGQRITGDDRAAMLREYRDTGAMLGAFLVDPADYGDDDDLSALGPESTEIDWTGFEGDEIKIVGTSGALLGQIVGRATVETLREQLRECAATMGGDVAAYDADGYIIGMGERYLRGWTSWLATDLSTAEREEAIRMRGVHLRPEGA